VGIRTGQINRAAIGIARRKRRYLLRARFMQDRAAPLEASVPADVGALVTVDTEHRLSIDGGRLRCAGGRAAPAWGDPAVSSAAPYARRCGRAFLCQVTPGNLSTEARFGWRDAAQAPGNNGAGALRASYGRWRPIDAGIGVLDLDGYSAGSACQLACVLRSAGCWFLTQADTAGLWRLVWVSDAGSVSPVTANAVSYSLPFSLADLRVTDLGGAWADDYGIATDHLANAPDGATAVMAPDALVEVTWTPRVGDTQELSVRQIDDNNRWIVLCDQVAGTVKIVECNAGVETERASAAQTWTVGAAYRLVVICAGPSLAVYVANVAKASYALATFNQAATGVRVRLAASNLVCWPREVRLPAGT
jgi:hypothetical protein